MGSIAFVVGLGAIAMLFWGILSTFLSGSGSSVVLGKAIGLAVVLDAVPNESPNASCSAYIVALGFSCWNDIGVWLSPYLRESNHGDSVGLFEHKVGLSISDGVKVLVGGNGSKVLMGRGSMFRFRKKSVSDDDGNMVQRDRWVWYFVTKLNL